MSELAIMDYTGDTRLQWDKSNQEAVTAAAAKFAEFIGRGFAAFRVNPQGNQGEQITAFDPSAERIILIPAFVGG